MQNWIREKIREKLIKRRAPDERVLAKNLPVTLDSTSVLPCQHYDASWDGGYFCPAQLQQISLLDQCLQNDQ